MRAPVWSTSCFRHVRCWLPGRTVQRVFWWNALFFIASIIHQRQPQWVEWLRSPFISEVAWQSVSVIKLQSRNKTNVSMDDEEIQHGTFLFQTTTLVKSNPSRAAVETIENHNESTKSTYCYLRVNQIQLKTEATQQWKHWSDKFDLDWVNHPSDRC